MVFTALQPHTELQAGESITNLHSLVIKRTTTHYAILYFLEGFFLVVYHKGGKKKITFRKMNTITWKAFHIVSLLSFFFFFKWTFLDCIKVDRARKMQNSRLIIYLTESLQLCKDHGLVLLRTYYNRMHSKCFSRTETQKQLHKVSKCTFIKSPKCYQDYRNHIREVYFTPDPFGIAVSSTNR